MRSWSLAVAVLLLTTCGQPDDDPAAMPDLATDGCASLPVCDSNAGCLAGQHCIEVAAGGRRCVGPDDHCVLGQFCGFADSCADGKILRTTYGNPRRSCAPEYIVCKHACVEAFASVDGGVAAAHCR